MKATAGTLAAIVGIPILLLVVLAGGIGGIAAGGFPAALGVAGGQPGSSAIPLAYLVTYQAASTTCPGLPWEVLAGIGEVESNHGESNSPGVQSGANQAGAEGPMQFEPATFGQYAEPVPEGGANPPSPYDPIDAIYAAARMLCANGAAGGANIEAAVYSYNHDEGYVATVMAWAGLYTAVYQSGSDSPGGGESPQAAKAVAFALAEVGVPYVWGGEGPGGFDCSGLVQAAYAAAGIMMPRGAQGQFDAGPHVPSGAPLAPGDLVFFGGGSQSVEHVGIYVGNSEMVDAPHTGASVRVERYIWSDFIGATRPT